jgi:hypothetical protein
MNHDAEWSRLFVFLDFLVEPIVNRLESGGSFLPAVAFSATNISARCGSADSL